jgi:hypothetical protein
VRSQHGVVARRQLRALGFSEKAIEHRIAVGRLHRVGAGIYAVGRRELTREGRWMAAVLACGPDALLSHGSAAALWAIGPQWRLIEVIVRRRGWPRRSEYKVRSRPSLPNQDVTIHHRIPITTPPRTVLDQAATPISDASLERLVNEAAAHEGIDLAPESLRRYVDLRPGEPGAPRLRTLLDRDTFRLSDSELERRFRPLAQPPACPNPKPKPSSTTTKSTSSGPTSPSWSRPTPYGLPALPPHRRQAVPRPPPRPDPHRLRPHHPALHPPAGPLPPSARRRSPPRHPSAPPSLRRLPRLRPHPAGVATGGVAPKTPKPPPRPAPPPSRTSTPRRSR